MSAYFGISCPRRKNYFDKSCWIYRPYIRAYYGKKEYEDYFMIETKPIYYMPGERSSVSDLGQTLKSLLPKNRLPLIVLGIGSTLVSGDRLGPRVGSLMSSHTSDDLIVFGTEEEPVHALNLDHTLEKIRLDYPDAAILAVDASLSSRKYLGQITVGQGPVHPGSGIHKELTGIGDVHITGIVSITGMMEYFILRHVPKTQVDKLASIIADGILCGIT